MDTETRQEFLEIVISESERLTRLINEVLELAEIQAGRMQWNMEDVDLKAVMENSVATLSQVSEQADIQLETVLPNSVPVVHADRDRLVQVVINLLSNAQRFCRPDDGRVKVALESTGSELVTHIKDNGPGIPKADCEATFDRFHQVREGQTGNPLGAGLGIAICQRIVDHIGGRIWVESEKGEGAEFIFTNPCLR